MAKQPTPPTQPATTPSTMLAAIDHLIDLVQADAQALDGDGHGPQRLPAGDRGAPSPAGPPRSLADLDLFVVRLKQVKDWLQQDPRLLPVIDDYIGVQVRAMEQRQTRQNFGLALGTTVVGALLGWVVSLLGTPASLFHLFLK